MITSATYHAAYCRQGTHDVYVFPEHGAYPTFDLAAKAAIEAGSRVPKGKLTLHVVRRLLTHSGVLWSVSSVEDYFFSSCSPPANWDDEEKETVPEAYTRCLRRADECLRKGEIGKALSFEKAAISIWSGAELSIPYGYVPQPEKDDFS